MTLTAVLTLIVRVVLISSMVSGAIAVFFLHRVNKAMKVYPGDENRAFLLQRIRMGARNGAEHWEPRWHRFLGLSLIFLGLPALAILGMWNPG